MIKHMYSCDLCKEQVANERALTLVKGWVVDYPDMGHELCYDCTKAVHDAAMVVWKKLWKK